MEENKKPWLSKTVWFGLATGLSPFLMALLGVDVGGVLAENGEAIGMVWGAIAIVLRLVTKDKVKLIG